MCSYGYVFSPVVEEGEANESVKSVIQNLVSSGLPKLTATRKCSNAMGLVNISLFDLIINAFAVGIFWPFRKKGIQSN